MSSDMLFTPSPSTGIPSTTYAQCLPYLELARLNKPIAILNFAFPALFGLLLAALTAAPLIQPSQLIAPTLLLSFASIMVRCIACAVNDILDQDVDRKVSRTRSRPMARGAISTANSRIYTAFLSALDLGILHYYAPKPVSYNALWIFILCTYPLGKRVTDYTSISLGLGISWGVSVAFPTLGIDVRSSPPLSWAAMFLALSHAARMMGQDFIYDFQDLRDDKAIGNGSTAVRYENCGEAVLTIFAILQILFLATTGLAVGAGYYYYFLALGATASGLWRIYGKVKLSDPQDCALHFRAGAVIVPTGTVLGLLAEYLARLVNENTGIMG